MAHNGSVDPARFLSHIEAARDHDIATLFKSYYQPVAPDQRTIGGARRTT